MGCSNISIMKDSFLYIENVSKSFDDVKALDNVSLAIKKSELFSLLGSSGCGKSTLLRIIAGFEKPDSGKIFLDGEDITDLPAYKRPLNIMFQSYALFPHLNVFNNISFGLKEDRLDKNEIISRTEEMINLLELNGLEKRKVDEISGGQQQRVALARCLVKKPKLLLLDEPLAALDKKLRIQTQFQLVNLQYKLGITFIIVTHDQEEAMSLSDRMAIMQEGNILQIGNPVEIYEKPNNEYIAKFIGTANIISIENNQKKKNFFTSPDLNVEIETSINKISTKCLIRPEKIHIMKSTIDKKISSVNSCKGYVKEVAYLGSYTKYLIESNNFHFYVFQTNNFISENLNIKWDDVVDCSWDKEAIFLL